MRMSIGITNITRDSRPLVGPKKRWRVALVVLTLPAAPVRWLDPKSGATDVRSTSVPIADGVFALQQTRPAPDLRVIQLSTRNGSPSRFSWDRFQMPAISIPIGYPGNTLILAYVPRGTFGIAIANGARLLWCTSTALRTSSYRKIA